MRGTWSLAVIAVVLLGCKQKPASPEAGVGAGGAPLDTVSRPTASVPPDSAPWEADSAATPSSLTPVKRDSADSADSAKADSAKKKPTSSSSAAPTKPGSPPAAAAPATGTTLPAAASQSASSGSEMRDAYHTAPMDTVDGKTYQGWKYYNLNCARCHGEDVAGTTIAPHLIVSLKADGPIPTEALFTKTVCEGRVEKGMPAWCQTGLTKEQIDTIYSYVKGRSDAKLHPGRPARSGG